MLSKVGENKELATSQRRFHTQFLPCIAKANGGGQNGNPHFKLTAVTMANFVLENSGL